MYLGGKMDDDTVDAAVVSIGADYDNGVARRRRTLSIDQFSCIGNPCVALALVGNMTILPSGHLRVQYEVWAIPEGGGSATTTASGTWIFDPSGYGAPAGVNVHDIAAVAGEPVTLSSAFADPALDTFPTRRVWYAGDGTSIDLGTGVGTAANVTHTYAFAGNYPGVLVYYIWGPARHDWIPVARPVPRCGEPAAVALGKVARMTRATGRVGWRVGLCLLVVAGAGCNASDDRDAKGVVVGELPAAAHGPYPVVDVVDGDTLKVNAPERITIRVIGIDTPETVDPRRPVQCFGSEASARARRTARRHRRVPRIGSDAGRARPVRPNPRVRVAARRSVARRDTDRRGLRARVHLRHAVRVPGRLQRGRGGRATPSVASGRPTPARERGDVGHRSGAKPRNGAEWSA